jgi:hypothetical protein
MRRLGLTTLLLLVAGEGCSGSSTAAGDGGPGAGGSGGFAGRGGTGGIDGGGAGGGGGSGGGVDPSCIRPDAQLHKFLNLDVRGDGFGAHEGQAVHLVTRISTSGVLGAGRVTVASGGFAIHFEGGYQRNTSQQLIWFADQDGDGTCNPAMGDHMGYVALGPFDPAADDALAVTISDNHVTDVAGDPSVCSANRPFGGMTDMNVTATGFAAHDGSTVYVLTRTFQNGAVFGRGQATVASGGFSLHLPRGFVVMTYQEVLWFVDVDGDGVCTANDHLGYTVTAAAVPTGNQPFDQMISDNHTDMSARAADVCVVMNGCPIAP